MLIDDGKHEWNWLPNQCKNIVTGTTCITPAMKISNGVKYISSISEYHCGMGLDMDSFLCNDNGYYGYY